MELSQKIKAYEAVIKEAGLTLTAFFEAVPVDRATWSRWRTGQTTPNMSTWMRVESALGRLDDIKESKNE